MTDRDPPFVCTLANGTTQEFNIGDKITASIQGADQNLPHPFLPIKEQPILLRVLVSQRNDEVFAEPVLLDFHVYPSQLDEMAEGGGVLEAVVDTGLNIAAMKPGHWTPAASAPYMDKIVYHGFKPIPKREDAPVVGM